MKSQLCLILLIILMSAHPGRTEGLCPNGYYQTTPTGPQGPVGCAPIPQGNQPAANWTDPWGAAAEDQETGVFGISADMLSKSKASSSAIEDCQSRGGKKCNVIMTYNNQCLAIVSSISNYGITSAETEKKAIESATRTCRKSSQGNRCWTYYSGCSLPRRIQ